MREAWCDREGAGTFPVPSRFRIASPRSREAPSRAPFIFMTTALFLAVSFAGGVLTIASPCVLPVVPLVLGPGASAPSRTRLGMLLGLGIAFAASVTAGTAGLRWLAVASTAGRWVALGVLAAVGLALISPLFAARLTAPLVAFGARLSRLEANASLGRAMLVGGAVGLLWTPCAGPILGLIVTVAATQGLQPATLAAYGAFAAGAVGALGLVLAGGARLAAGMRRLSGADRWLRPALGGATLAAVVAIGAGWDRALLAQGNFPSQGAAEEGLLRVARVNRAGLRARAAAADTLEGRRFLRDEGAAAELVGGQAWINSPPLRIADLRGKVVLVDFWTFGCINCLHVLPHVKSWYAKYRDQGFVVIGVHTPEFPHERVRGNVEREVAALGVAYPVVQDNDYAIWRAFANEYWPAAYFIDANGRIRFHHFGEGRYDDAEQVIRALLSEAHGTAGGT
jgi:cytochrome c biogenesis protein CcdA/thiol-disulfide isomerase/thioredoxin